MFLNERAVALGELGVLFEALGDLRFAGIGFTGSELPGEHGALAEDTHGGPEGRLQLAGLLAEQVLAVVGVSDVAAKTQEIILCNLPQGAAAFGTREDGDL